MKKLKYLTLFTGIGGLDTGLEKRGYECVGFSEIKQSSVRIYNKHYPEHKNFGDITTIDPKELPDFDILTGGFPCQSFSLAGLRKGFADTKGKKGQMIFYIYNILVEKKPKFVVLENVKGLLLHNNGKTYQSVFKLLMHAGYNVRVLLLNSANYGSAQGRERIVFLCSREDFDKVQPERIDNTKRFRDFIDTQTEKKILPDELAERFLTGDRRAVFIGGYDRVNTLTTGIASSGRASVIIQEGENKYRYLTILEGERLQGFPDGWTEGESMTDRWFAIGNAVNCRVSDYIFNEYLNGIWW